MKVFVRKYEIFIRWNELTWILVLCGHFVLNKLHLCPKSCSFWHLFSSIFTRQVVFRILPCICKSVFKRVVPQLFFNLQNFRKCAKSEFFLLSRKLHLLKGLCCSTKLCEHYVHQKIQQSLSSIVQQKSMIPASNDLKIDRGFQANVVS